MKKIKEVSSSESNFNVISGFKIDCFKGNKEIINFMISGLPFHTTGTKSFGEVF